jgi:hypothetical protein
MSVDSTSDRVKNLISAADDATKAGALVKAVESLREASHIEPNNAQIRERWAKLQHAEAGADVPELLRSYLGGQAENCGQEALQALKAKQLPTDVAVEAAELLLNTAGAQPLLDSLTGTLLYRNLEARKRVATKLSDNATEIFEQLFERGEESLGALAIVPLEDAAWSSKDLQLAAQRDVFRLCVATLIEAGAEHLERVMRCVARLLSVASDTVTDLIDADVFDAILSSLDIRLPAALRSQAVVATSKLLETTKQRGDELFSNFITERAAKQSNNDFIIAFSAAAAVFPIIPAVASRLFLIDGFVQQLVPNLERNWEDGAAGKR